jgi:hypothetical protein
MMSRVRRKPVLIVACSVGIIGIMVASKFLGKETQQPVFRKEEGPRSTAHLFGIVERDGTDATRDEAIVELVDRGRRGDLSAETIIRLVGRLRTEPRACLRESILIGLGALYEAHPRDCGFVMEALENSLAHDAAAGVRKTAAHVLASLDNRGVRTILSRALHEERDPGVQTDLTTLLTLLD